MPGETHQIGDDIDADKVLSLLLTLLGLPEGDHAGETTLADFDIDGDDALDLWGAVCEEFVEPMLGSEIAPDLLVPAMAVAASMAAKLTSGGHGDS